MALLGDKALLFSPSGRSFIAYRVRGRRWIAMGEPAGIAAERLPLLWAFAEMADSYGGAAVFYSVGEGLLGDLAAPEAPEAPWLPAPPLPPAPPVLPV